MKRLLVVIALVTLVVPAVASAHPLGNFTTNSYAEVVASGDRLYVHWVLDLAEVPTFQAAADRERLGRQAYAASLVASVRAGLVLRVDGRARPLIPIRQRVSFPDGVASLRTTRLELVLDAGSLEPGRQVAVELENAAFGSRIGWREIVVRAERGAELASSARAVSISGRLRSYPRSGLRSPLDERAASFQVEGSASTGVAPTFGARPDTFVEKPPEGGFASLVEQDDLGPGVVLVALLLAMFWGAAHALTPGHGKAIVAAYLVGTKGRPRDALALGGIVTVTHTIGVFALGVATLALSELFVPEDLYPWMNLVSALLVVAVGVVVLRDRVRVALGRGSSHGHEHGSGHDHDHALMTDDEHARAHLPVQGRGARGLLAVGISGGLLPCPTALVVLLAAISLHRVAFGLVLILAFSIGLASVITAIGLVAVGARSSFRRLSLDGTLVRALPAVSALLVFGIGVVMTVRAVPALL